MDVTNLKYFVLFIGHGRSGHSLVGAMLNSHPNMVIANELDILRQFDVTPNNLNKMYKSILKKGPHIWKPLRDKDLGWKWLGQYKVLEVMGTKLGGGTESYLREHYEDLDKLKKILPVPLKFIHVKRNMYDNISTMLKHGGPKHGFSDLDSAIDLYFAGIPTIKRVRAEEDVIKVKHEDFISNPKKVLTKICADLEMDAYPDYLDFCDSIVWNKPRITRHNANWESKHIERVEKLKQDVDFLREYTFDN